MRITKPEDIKIGQWRSMCCHEDLRQIEDQEEVDWIIDFWDEIGGISSPSVWDTKKNALLDMRKGVVDNANDVRKQGTPEKVIQMVFGKEIDKIDQLLAELEDE